MEDNFKQTDTKRTYQKKNLKIKNTPRFAISVIVLILVICIVILCLVNRKVKINDNTKLDNLNASKYSQELVSEYNKQGQKEKFLEDYDAVQTQVAMYILDNSTLDDNSFVNIQNTLQSELNKKEWKQFSLQKPTHWNGEWSVDSTGTLKFKFENKQIEPSWLNDSDLAVKIIKN